MKNVSFAQRFTSSIVWNITGKIFLGMIGFVTSILIARSLGKENLGIYASLLTLPKCMYLFATFGFEIILNLQLPMLIARGQRKQTVFLTSRLLIGRIFIAALFCLGLYLLQPFLEEWLHLEGLRSYVPYIACYFFCLVLVSFVSMVPRSLLKIKEVSLLESLNLLGNLLLLVMFSLLFELTIERVFIGYIVSTGIVIFIFVFLFRQFYFGESSPLHMKEIFEIGAAATLSTLLAFGLGQQIDILLMNYFKVKQEAIGFYYLAASIVPMLSFLSVGVFALSRSSFVEQYAARGNEGLVSTFPIIVKVWVLLTLPFGFVGVFFARDLILSFYGIDYVETTGLLQFCAAFSCIQIIMGSILCAPLFYIIRSKVVLLSLQFLGGGINIILDLILIPHYGALGAVVATGFSGVLIGGVMMLYLWKKIGIYLPWLFEIKIVAMCLVGVFCASLMGGTGIFYLGAKGVLCLVVFVLMAKWLKPLEENDREMIRRVNPFLYEIANHF